MNTATNADLPHRRPHPCITQAALLHCKLAANGTAPDSDADVAQQETVAFKDAMIHEVNHRAKNTLQVAASMLSLHARATPSAEVREALQDSCRRLQVLAAVHELLYSTPNSTELVLMPRLLQTLGDALGQSLFHASARVRLELKSDAIALPADIAIPIALLTNEAVTNAYKHAFANDAHGTVTVHLQCAPRNSLLLQISDTGSGMPRDQGEDGMGLKLIRIFAAQLHGVLSFAKQADHTGTVISLTIARPQ